MAAGRAWLASGDDERATALLDLARVALPEDRLSAWAQTKLDVIQAQRERGDALPDDAAWQVLSSVPNADPVLQARAVIVDIAHLEDDDARTAVAQCDRALALLAGAGPRERVPYYAQRVAWMERGGASADQVAEYLQDNGGDPAVGLLADIALVPGAAGLLGRAAPGSDGVGVAGDAIDLAAHEGPVVVALRRGRLSRPFCSQ